MKSTTDSPTETPISERVIEKVAAATNSDPIDLEPLFSRIDPDALDSLFSNGAGGLVRDQGELTFPMSGCSVTVSADGTVDVEPQGEHHGAFGAGAVGARTSPAESPD